LQAWQPIIIQTSAATQEPAAQSSIDRESLTLTVQDKLTDVNLGGLSTCKSDLLKAGNWISWKTQIHKFFKLFEITDVVHGTNLMPEDPIAA
jgi:hypothetical protein